MTFELPVSVIQGLKQLAAEIPLEQSRKLITNTVKLTLYPDASIPPDPEINSINIIKINTSESAIASLFSLATKHSYDSRKLRTLLEQHNINNHAIKELTGIFEENRKEYFLQHLQTAHAFPHITDVEWRIQSDVKSSMSDRSSGELTFQISFGNYHALTGDRDTIVEFLCNTEELQSLLNKLKEIERHCENIANK